MTNHFRMRLLPGIIGLLLLSVFAQSQTITPPPVSGGAALGYNYISPTNTSADATVLQAAVNGSQPVFMNAGTWQICSQISVPANQLIVGMGSSSDPGNLVASTTFGRTVVTCPDNGSFSSGQAYFALQDHDVLRGVDIFCHDGASPSFNGINALNAVAPEIDHNSVYFCKEGISRFSDGNVPGHSGAFSQLARIHDNMLYKNTDYGYYAAEANGGNISDELIGPNNDFAVNLNGQLLLTNGTTEAVFNNRIEDEALGINLINGWDVVISGNICDKVQCIKMSNSQGISVIGNYGDYGTGFGGSLDVEFSGTNTNIQFAGNAWQNTTVYKVDAGGTFVNSSFNEVPSTGSSIYADAYSQSIIQPLLASSTGSVNSVSAAVSAINVDANVANILVGGDGMTGGTWAANTTRATLTTAAGSNPYGASTAASLTEDSTAANTHYTGENNAEAAGTYTYSIYLHTGSSGTDNIELAVYDGSFADAIGAVFVPSTGAFLGAANVTGTGSIISTGSLSAGNGWYRVWVTFTLGANTPAWQYIFMAQGASNFFNGNGTNNVLIWGPALRAGTVP